MANDMDVTYDFVSGLHAVTGRFVLGGRTDPRVRASGVDQ